MARTKEAQTRRSVHLRSHCRACPRLECPLRRAVDARKLDLLAGEVGGPSTRQWRDGRPGVAHTHAGMHYGRRTETKETAPLQPLPPVRR
eukprot:356123-Chlamydomonas_euryale.AAC.7